jgi:alpha-glucosidase (family GH31 glycosyl hydrolase)
MKVDTLNWSKAAAGVWRATVGPSETMTPLSAMGISPVLEALNALGEKPFPIPQNTLKGEVTDQRTIVQIPLEADEQIFGLGLQFMRINHRGRTRYLRVNSDPAQDTGETHAPIPFYVSSKGYGVLINTTRIVTILCGSCIRKDSPHPPVLRDRVTDPQWNPTPVSDSVEAVVYGKGLEILVFAGPTVLDAVRRYNLFCGGGCLPPRWGLGFWHRVPLPFRDEDVIKEAREFRKRDFPCDVIGLEPGWHSASYPCTYTWDKTRFPKPAQFVRDMASDGFQINLWEHAFVHPQSGMYSSLEPLSGSHTVWGGLAPDLSMPKVQEIYRNQHGREHVDIGVSGYKLDECDGSELTGCSWMFPGHATFPSGLDGEQMRQIYGLMFQKTTTDLFRRHNRRTYGLVRASMAGSAPIPYVLYSDLYDHRQFVRALCNSGFSGILWCPEVRTAAGPEDWVRRMQVVCFSPLAMLNAWCDGTKPWSFTDVEPIIRKYVKLRMRLIPYFYSAFAQYHFQGIPPFRPMAMEDPGLAEVDNQYMAGDSLLVTPLFAGEIEREVKLPPGAWYDFETGQKYDGGQTIKVKPGLETIPVFVRDGGIIPMMPAMDHAPKAGQKVPLEIRHYGSKQGMFMLYDDDGETFNYEKGQFRWRKLEVTYGPDGKPRGSVAPPDAGWQSSYGEITWKY